MRVLYTAAHAGFARELAPLGGGAAVANQLIAEWTRTRPFELQVLDPSILGCAAPTGQELVRFGERAYARFCRDFGRAVTERVLASDPRHTAVLVNDVSEGPDFQALAAGGFSIYTIYHVDVVAYVADIYARGWVKPETMVRWYDRAPFLVPPIGRLVFEKQLQTVLHSRRIIVPSQRMQSVIESCYGLERARDKVSVIPWGTWAEDGDPLAVNDECARLRAEFEIPHGARVLLTLSRISPEKGQDLLLTALRDWQPGYPVVLIICGEAAFMQGIRFLARLRELAGQVSHVRVIFPGYVTGLRKQALQRLAHLYVFPSRHESYGLTLLEALHAGLPAVCLDHHGAREVMRPEFGRVVSPSGLRPAIEQVLADEPERLRMAHAARAYAGTQRFSSAAGKLAGVIRAYSGGGSSKAAV